jgi:two-component system, OmpR family, sensor kinase
MPALKDGSAFAVLTAEDDPGFYIKVTRVTLGGQTHFLVVAQSLADTTNTMGRMGFFLLVSILVILILALVSGALLIRRALSPVRRVTATAQSIESSSDLGRRVGYRGPRDEIGQLATTFDRMIERLDNALKAQKSFVADASHELRGPLTVMQGNLDLLKRDLKEEDRRESLRALGAETSRMSKVVSDLLVLAELDSGQPERQDAVALRDMLLDAQRRARQLAGNRQIVVGRQEDLWVKGNADKLEQVLSNLVDNAVKYTPEGGTITLSLFRQGEWACLAVADTGIGISGQDLPHIFDRFYRVDKARSKSSGGTGLGLAIVKGIVERHGGRVTVASEPGKGSTFTVWLKL